VKCTTAGFGELVGQLLAEDERNLRSALEIQRYASASWAPTVSYRHLMPGNEERWVARTKQEEHGDVEPRWI